MYNILYIHNMTILKRKILSNRVLGKAILQFALTVDIIT